MEYPLKNLFIVSDSGGCLVVKKKSTPYLIFANDEKEAIHLFCKKYIMPSQWFTEQIYSIGLYGFVGRLLDEELIQIKYGTWASNVHDPIIKVDLIKKVKILFKDEAAYSDRYLAFVYSVDDFLKNLPETINYEKALAEKYNFPKEMIFEFAKLYAKDFEFFCLDNSNLLST